ncbi:MAG: B12-binding domain-containing radical SAM protein [Candidatus Bathyarchaeia archaeon]
MRNSKRVILVNPNIPEYPKYLRAHMFYKTRNPPSLPLGLLYIAAVLERDGVDVEVIDNYLLDLSTEELVNKIKRGNPALLGFSVMTFTYPESRRNMTRLKEEMPEVPIVVGGPHATLFPEELIKEPFIDIVVRGEGEQTTREIVQALNDDNTFSRDALKLVDGITFKDEGKVFWNKDRAFIKDLDGLPFPARHLVDMKKYPREVPFYLPNVRPVDVMCSSRGCPFACAFCSSEIIWKRSYRFRSAKNTADEIEHLIEDYDSKGIYFREDNFTLNNKRVVELCKEIKRRRLDFEWICESRVDLITDDVLKEMTSAGCRAIWFGFESGSQKTLDYIKKGFTLSDAERAVKLCKKHGLTVGGLFMLGLPNETREDILETLDFMVKLDVDRLMAQHYVGIPVSEIYSEVLEKKYYRYEWEKILIIETPDLSRSEILKLEDYVNREFKVQRMLRKLRDLKTSKLPSVIIDMYELLKGIENKRANIPIHLRDLIRSVLSGNRIYQLV